MSDAPELKPCPFCGSSDVLHDGAGNPLNEDQKVFEWVACQNCGACSATENTWIDARTAWNRRSDLARLPDDMVERIKTRKTNWAVGEEYILLGDILAWHEQQEGRE